MLKGPADWFAYVIACLAALAIGASITFSFMAHL